MNSDQDPVQRIHSSEAESDTKEGVSFEIDERKIEKQKVSPKEVIKQAGLKGKEGHVKNLAPVQRIGVWLALGVGGMIGWVLIVLILVWLSILLRAPAITKIEDYTALTNSITEASTKIFDLVIFKALLPVFTGIIGVLLGRSLPREGR